MSIRISKLTQKLMEYESRSLHDDLKSSTNKLNKKVNNCANNEAINYLI